MWIAMNNRFFQVIAKACFGLVLWIGVLGFPNVGVAADLQKLESLYVENFDAFYEPRFCGRNIARLVKAATQERVDLQGAYILKIEGAGFFETSGFYTRNMPNKRAHLGYFHVVLVADDKVFDFDLHEPLALDLKDYIRLQFSPAREPLVIFGTTYRAREELKWWTVTRFEIDHYAQDSGQSTWTMKMKEFIDLNSVFAQSRVR